MIKPFDRKARSRRFVAKYLSQQLNEPLAFVYRSLAR
jgi:hypothetical protein